MDCWTLSPIVPAMSGWAWHRWARHDIMPHNREWQLFLWECQPQSSDLHCAWKPLDHTFRWASEVTVASRLQVGAGAKHQLQCDHLWSTIGYCVCDGWFDQERCRRFELVVWKSQHYPRTYIERGFRFPSPSALTEHDCHDCEGSHQKGFPSNSLYQDGSEDCCQQLHRHTDDTTDVLRQAGACSLGINE